MSLFVRGMKLPTRKAEKRDKSTNPDTLSEPSQERILAPAQRLNYDVLSIIFDYSWDMDHEVSTILASVCRSWRASAISMPRIWTHIAFDGSDSVERTRMYITRSQELRLHARLSRATDSLTEQALFRQVHRVHCLYLDDRPELVARKFPRVERLTLGVSAFAAANPSFADNSKTPLRISCFPELRELTVWRVETPWLKALSPGPEFPPLQALTIQSVGEDAMNIIQHCSETLLSLEFYFPNAANNYFPLSLPRLKHLSVTKSGHSWTHMYMNQEINAPQLRSLKLLAHEVGMAARIDLFPNPPAITELAVSGIEFDLALFPRLRRLWVRERAHSAQRLVNPLIRGLSSCPELDSIHFSCRSPTVEKTAFLEQTLLDVIQASLRDITLANMDSHEEFIPGHRSRGVRYSLPYYEMR